MTIREYLEAAWNAHNAESHGIAFEYIHNAVCAIAEDLSKLGAKSEEQIISDFRNLAEVHRQRREARAKEDAQEILSTIDNYRAHLESDKSAGDCGFSNADEKELKRVTELLAKLTKPKASQLTS